jgi:hypothetical protein
VVIEGEAEFRELAFERFEVGVEVWVATGRELVESGKKGGDVANAGGVIVTIHIQIPSVDGGGAEAPPD